MNKDDSFYLIKCGAAAKRKLNYSSLFMEINWKERAEQKGKQERKQNPPDPPKFQRIGRVEYSILPELILFFNKKKTFY